MIRSWWMLPAACWLLIQSTARADGIDLPILLGAGVGVLLPLLLFNATLEAPVVARLVGLGFSELWWPWLKANMWSLIGGIPVLAFNAALKDWLVPTELALRVRVYPRFLVLAITVYFAATVLIEFLYLRRLVRPRATVTERSTLLRAVLAANLASYLVLGPVLFYREYPRTEVREFTADARWAHTPAVEILVVGRCGHLESVHADGQGGRTIVPQEVRDYVVSADLRQVLYRGAGDRYFFCEQGTNTPLPELGVRSRAPEMDFSPDGRHAAFLGTVQGTSTLRIVDVRTAILRIAPCVGAEVGGFDRLTWSARSNVFYLRSGLDSWEISVGQEIISSRLRKTPDDFADHFGRLGNTWSREGVFYTSHEQGQRKLLVYGGFGSGRLWVRDPQGTSLMIRDPAGWLTVEQAVFLGGPGEVLFGLGGHVYLMDCGTRKVGHLIQGERFMALAAPFSKGADFAGP